MRVLRGFTRVDVLIVAAIIAILVLFFATRIGHVRDSPGRAAAEERQISTALGSFFLDNGCYPLPEKPQQSGSSVQKNMFGELASAYTEIGHGARAKRIYLTTPISYMSSLPFEPFRGRGNEFSYLYMSDGISYYVIISYGPDGVPDILHDGGSINLPFLIYSPSNGVSSRGDIITAGP